MRKYKSRKKPNSKPKARSKTRNKDRSFPLLFLAIIAVVLLFLYALPRHRYKKEQITQTGVSVGSYPVVILQNATKSVAPQSNEVRKTISVFIPAQMPQEKEIVIVEPKTENKPVSFQQPKEKTEVKALAAAPLEKQPVLAQSKNTKAVLNTQTKSNVSVKSVPKVQQKEKPVIYSGYSNGSVAVAAEQKPIVRKPEVKLEVRIEPKPEKKPEIKLAETKPEIKPEKTELKLAKNSQTQNVEPKKSNVSPRPREDKSIQIAKLPIEILPRIFKPRIKGKIAIVLDDWGYSFEYFDLVRSIRQPLTLAILPNLPYSQRIAVEAKKKGFEVILHLPMEPYPREDLVLEKDTIMTDMDDLTIDDIVSKQIKRIPYASGVNNHMGSKATEDSRVMRVVFEELKKQNLYFLDSVTSNSVCPIVAQEVKINFTKRDVFLDNENDPEYIKSQIIKLKEEAEVRGYAIGIGHARRVTLEVLREIMPKLQKEGFKFVTASELAR